MSDKDQPDSTPNWDERPVINDPVNPNHFQRVSPAVKPLGPIPDEPSPPTEAIPILEDSFDIEEDDDEVESDDDFEDLDDPYRNAAYNDRPHVTQFINSVIAQCIVWLLCVALAVWLSIANPDFTNIVLVILTVVTLINAFFIKRTHIIWSGTRHIITKEFVTIQRSDSILFLIFRDKETSIRKSTLVGQDRQRRTLTEHLFFRTRGRAMLTTQDSNKPPVIISYVRDIEAFMIALKK